MKDSFPDSDSDDDEKEIARVAEKDENEIRSGGRAEKMDAGGTIDGSDCAVVVIGLDQSLSLGWNNNMWKAH